MKTCVVSRASSRRTYTVPLPIKNRIFREAEMPLRTFMEGTVGLMVDQLIQELDTTDLLIRQLQGEIL